MKRIYFVEEGDTLESIADRYKVKTMDITEYNKITAEDILPGVAIIINIVDGIRYVVRPYDTLDKIATKHGVTKEAICKHNKIKEVFLGQIIFLPIKDKE